MEGSSFYDSVHRILAYRKLPHHTVYVYAAIDVAAASEAADEGSEEHLERVERCVSKRPPIVVRNRDEDVDVNGRSHGSDGVKNDPRAGL